MPFRDPQVIAAIIGAGGLSSIAPILLRGIRDWRDGTHDREAREAADLISQRDDAVKRERAERARADAERDRADHEARRARVIREYASRLRGMLVEQCSMPPDRLPPWPTDHDH